MAQGNICLSIKVQVLLLVLLMPNFCRADVTEYSDIERKIALVLRVLSYDYELEKKATKHLVRVAIVYRNNDKASKDQASLVDEAFKEFKDVTVKKMPVEATVVPFSSQDVLKNTIEQQGVNTLFLCSGLDLDIEKILLLTRDKKISVTTDLRAYLSKGVTIGVIISEGQPKILINMKAATLHGHQFAARLLSVAELVE